MSQVRTVLVAVFVAVGLTAPVLVFHTATASEEALGRKQHELSPLFYAAQEVVSQYRLIHERKLSEAQTRQEPVTLRGHAAYVNSVAFSPDGKTLASGSLDWTVKLWVVDARQ